MKKFFSILILCMMMLSMAARADRDPVHWYSHQSGQWASFDNWTTDPSGINFVNPDLETPQPGDDVTILSGVMIEFLEGNTAKGIVDDGTLEIKNITIDGTLLLSNHHTENHIISGNLDGNGRIILSGDNFPEVGGSNLFNAKGGTVEFLNTSGITLTRDIEYGNIDIVGNAIPTTVTVANSLKCTGNISLIAGATLEINAATDNQKLEVQGNIYVGEGCSWVVNDNTKPFEIDLYGDLENDGSIRLVPSALDHVADDVLTEGYADIYFKNTSADQFVMCDKTTILHRIIMQKGVNDVYKLTFTAYNKDYFKLYGCSHNASSLILEAGTFVVGGNIVFDPLQSGSDYVVPANATIVVKSGAINTMSDIVVEGKLQINNGGELKSLSDNGIILAKSGVFDVKGAGKVDVAYIKNGTSDDDYGCYSQSNGVVTVKSFELKKENSSFAITGGVLNITGGLITLLSAESNSSVTGGVINLSSDDENNGIAITSYVPFPTLNISTSLSTSINATYNQNVSTQALRINGDLSVGNNVVLQPSGNDVCIGGNLVVEGAFDANSNNTIFNGDGDGEITVPSGFEFGELTINKNNHDDIVAANTSFTVSSNLEINSGVLRNGDNDIDVKHDVIINNGKIFSRGGYIVLVDGDHTLTTIHHNPGHFGNIYFKSGSSDLVLDGPVITDNFKMPDTDLKILLNGFTLEILKNLEGICTENRFFVNNGKASGGLKLHLTLTQGSDFEIVFHVGTETGGYTPATLNVSGSSVDHDFTGWLSVNAVDGSHPNLAGDNTDDRLCRYWIVKQNGFDNVPGEAVNYSFTPKSCTVDNSWTSAVLVPSKGWKQSEPVSNTSDVFHFHHSDYGIINGEYTCAAATCYNIKMWRTNSKLAFNNGAYRMQGINYDEDRLWRQLDAQGNETEIEGVPGPKDIAYVYFNRVHVRKDVNGVGQVVFVDTPVTHSEYESDEPEHQPRIQVNKGVKFNALRVSGEGVINQQITNTKKAPLELGDMSEFVNDRNSWIMYNIDGAEGIDGLVTYKQIPNLSIECAGPSEHSFYFKEDTKINFDVNLRGYVNYTFPETSEGNMYIGGDLYLGDWYDGKVTFNGNGEPHTLEVKGKLDYTIGEKVTDKRMITVSEGNQTAHKLIVHGDILLGDKGKLILANGGAGVNLILKGEGSEMSATDKNTNVHTLWTLEIDKERGHEFTINPDFTLVCTDDPLRLKSGHLIIKTKNKDRVYELGSDTKNFVIPADAELTTDGSSTKRATFKTRSGMVLSGKLHTIGCKWDVAGSIEYTESGSSSLEIDADYKEFEFKVGGQLRPTLTSGGSIALKLNSKFAKLSVGNNATVAANEHGLFEIVNNSELTMAAGSQVFVKNHISNSTVPDIYLDPKVYSVDTASVFYIRSGENSDKPATIFSKIEMPVVDIGFLTNNKHSQLSMMLGDLTLAGRLNIGGGSKLFTNGYNLYLKGNFYLKNKNDGFNHQKGTVYICGSTDQMFYGEPLTFYNLVKTSDKTVTFRKPITIENNAEFLDGIFRGFSVIAKGDVTNNAVFEWLGTKSVEVSGFVFESSKKQTLISNNGIFDKITIDNSYSQAGSYNVEMPTGNSFSVRKAVYLKKGKLFIGTNTMTMEKGAKFFDFAKNRYVVVTDAYAAGGVRKYFGSNETGDFTIPLGTTKYTPVIFNIEEITDGAYFQFRPVNEPPNCLLSSQLEHSLQYYWNNISEGVDNFKGTITLEHSDQNEALIKTSGCGKCNNNRTNYISAIQLYSSNKFSKSDNFTYSYNTKHLIFQFTNANSEDLSGKYIAGCKDALPDELNQVVSTEDGEFSQIVWKACDSDGNVISEDEVHNPENCYVHIKHNVKLDNHSGTHINKARIYEGGVLDLNGTMHNKLGTVFGKGTLRTDKGMLPSGVYTDFLSADGGTICYYGDGDKGSYSIMAQLDEVNNVIVEGSGLKSFPNSAVHILGNLTIRGSIDNKSNIPIYLNGDLAYECGDFMLGHGSDANIIFCGSQRQQQVSAEAGYSFSGKNSMYGIVVDNPLGVKLLTDVQLKYMLEFKRGIIDTHDGLLTITNDNPNYVVAGNSNDCFVDGPLCKYISKGNSFTFPVGANYGGELYRGDLLVQDVESDETSKWTAQYHYVDNVFNWEKQNLPQTILKSISTHEYWSVYAGNSDGVSESSCGARIATLWNEDYSKADFQNYARVRQVRYDDPNWVLSGNNPVATSVSPSIGFVASDDVMSISLKQDKPDFFTFGFDAEYEFDWIGGEDNDWFNPRNWKSNNPPSSSEDVTIASFSVDGEDNFMPVVNNPNVTATAKSLTIQTGATLTISSKSSITVSDDVVVEDGGELLLAAPTSSADNNHSIYPAGSLIYNGNFTGKVTFQRFVRGYQWERLCVPVTGYDPKPLKTCGSWYLYSYDEAKDINGADGYTYADGETDANNSTILASGWTMISDPDPTDLFSAYRYVCSKKQGPHVMSFTGTPLPNGSDSYTTKVNFSGNDIYTPEGGLPSHMLDGWNLVANPYLSAIDANELDFVNCDPVVYVHDNIDNASFAYAVPPQTVVGVLTGYNCRYIAAGQSFFVHAAPEADSYNGHITFSGKALVHGDPNDVHSTVIKRGNLTASDHADIEKLVFTTSGKGVDYRSVVFFASGATENFDSKFDAYMQSSNLQNLLMFYSFGSDKLTPLAANGLPSDIKNGGDISLGYTATTAGTYTLSLNDFSVKDAVIYLYDTKTGTKTELKQGFSCKIDVEAGTDNSRFKLLFRDNHPPVVNGELAHVFVDAGKTLEQSIKEVFVDNDPDDYIADIEVTAANGGVLPSWLDFDYDKGILVGNPTDNAEGEYEMDVTATDSYGAKTTYKFIITVASVIPDNPSEDPVVPENPADNPEEESNTEDADKPIDNVETAVSQPVDEQDVMVRLYPVPSFGRVTIELGNLIEETGTVQMYIYSSSGRLISHRSISDSIYELDLTGCRGVYVIRLQTPSKSIVRRIVIQ